MDIFDEAYDYGIYGQYRLLLTKHPAISNCSIVTMYDVTSDLPLMWSKTLPHQAAKGALDLFKKIGYFNMPVSTSEGLSESDKAFKGETV